MKCQQPSDTFPYRVVIKGSEPFHPESTEQRKLPGLHTDGGALPMSHPVLPLGDELQVAQAIGLRNQKSLCSCLYHSCPSDLWSN